MGLRTAFEVPPDATVELSSGLDVGRYVAQVSGQPDLLGLGSRRAAGSRHVPSHAGRAHLLFRWGGHLPRFAAPGPATSQPAPFV